MHPKLDASFLQARHVGRHLIASSQKFRSLAYAAPPGPEVLTLGLALARGAIDPLRPA